MLKRPTLEQRLMIKSYQEGGYTVFTELFHLERGTCCGSGCRHCPFLPRSQKGNREVDPTLDSAVVVDGRHG